jgi:hypothetical protein
MFTTIITLIAAAFAIWAIVGVARSKSTVEYKTVWFAIVIILPIIGPAAYYVASRKEP